MKAIVIGRHAGEIPGIEVIEQRNIQFPARSVDVLPVLQKLVDEAQAAGAKLLLQNTPGQVAVALSWMSTNGLLGIGIVINTPGERLAGVKRKFVMDNSQSANEAEKAVKFANPRASVGFGDSTALTVDMTVTVDPPMRFEFSHIEWM